jgi:hypothetical protein
MLSALSPSSSTPRIQISPHSLSLPYPSFLIAKFPPLFALQSLRSKTRRSLRHMGRRQKRSPPRKSRQSVSHTSHTARRRSGPCPCWVRPIGSIKFLSCVPLFSFRFRSTTLHSTGASYISVLPSYVDPPPSSSDLVDHAPPLAHLETIQLNAFAFCTAAPRHHRRATASAFGLVPSPLPLYSTGT